ncbi:uncharacterized protein B0J16DRAFT_383645 [Fusarium flagelliforme]|uniref:uncharacterized protein n=1 Tax=Fusarium flagelliforme TaxID=2675880 RepID=UPI001E8D67E5|nr:uncharacterized protein B0J16DRAFT_383645 [Fusarium flagelliforme]KAH7184597.1 hypothetical protein B0J16DRAFT_383645 [Fusarium flagelliforme]
MKSFIFLAAVLKAAEFVSANDLPAMEAPADTWCITYLPDDEVLSAQNSGRLPFAPSFRPTFARNTSVSITRSAMSTDIGPDSALFTSDVINTADTSLVNSESSDSDVDPTAVQSSSAILTFTGGVSTVVTATTDAEATSTSTDIIEPAGREVIFLIQTGVNEKRSFYKRANNEFVGDNSPEVCTFAATFNLAEDEGQLFASGLPIYYSGEDYKELSPQGRPPSGSITSGFTDTGGSLAFRNSELPNGEAGFCQDADGQVYITFTSGPSGCTPVNLGIYNVELCQDGRLIGLDESTSTGSVTVTATADNSLSTQSTSGELLESTSLVPSESTISASQTSEFETSVTESFAQGPDDTRSQETSVSTATDDIETLSSVSTTSGDPASDPLTASTSQLATETSELLDPTATSNDGTGLSTTSVVESQATTGIERFDTETTITTSLSETTIIPETTETTGVDTSSIEAVSDIDTTTADTMDTTTANDDTTTLPENPTTTEAETTTAEITTTAEPTTTTTAAPEPTPQFACGDAGYTTTYTYNGVTFNFLCGRNSSFNKLIFRTTMLFRDVL